MKRKAREVVFQLRRKIRCVLGDLFSTHKGVANKSTNLCQNPEHMVGKILGRKWITGPDCQRVNEKTPIFAIAQFLVNEKNKTELNTEIFHDF